MCVKAQYDLFVHPHVFSNGDLVFANDQDHDKLEVGMFEPLLHGPYVVNCTHQKGAYGLSNYEGNAFISYIL